MEHTVAVKLTATTRETLDQMLEELARSACDIANSTEDDGAHIVITERRATVKRKTEQPRLNVRRTMERLGVRFTDGEGLGE